MPKQRKEERPFCPSEGPEAAPAQSALPGKGAAREGHWRCPAPMLSSGWSPMPQYRIAAIHFGSLLLQWDLSNSTSCTLPKRNKRDYSTPTGETEGTDFPHWTQTYKIQHRAPAQEKWVTAICRPSDLHDSGSSIPEKHYFSTTEYEDYSDEA